VNQLKYVEHNNSDKPTFFVVRNIVQQNVHSVMVINKAFGSNGSELSEAANGIQHDLNTYPRINTGFLYHSFKVERGKDSVKVFHVTETRPKLLLCEVVMEGGEP
jgi:hypothetical protein